MAGIVDAVGIDDERGHQAAQVQKLIPIAVVAGQTRDLQPEDGARTAEAHVGDEALEAGPAGRRRPGLAQILIDDHHVGPAEAARVVGELVLTAPALVVIAHLPQGGLPHIDEGGAGEVFGPNLLATHRHRSGPSDRVGLPARAARAVR